VYEDRVRFTVKRIFRIDREVREMPNKGAKFIKKEK
jgi:hypothetical protein